MDEEILCEVGLGKSEAKVYLSLLERGSCKAGKLATDTGLNRTTIYKALDNLSERGLVSHLLKENRKYFQASDPSNMQQLLDREEKRLESRKKSLQTILPDLCTIFESKKEDTEASLFKGKKGLRAVFEDILKTLESGDKYLAFGVPEHAKIFWGYFETFNRRLHENKIKCKIIFDERATENIDSCTHHGYSVRTLPKEYVSPAEINIYGQNVAIVLWQQNPLAILIRSEEIARGFRQYFRLLWKIAEEPTGHREKTL